MQGDSSTVLANSATEAAATATRVAVAHEGGGDELGGGGGGGGGNSGEDRIGVDEADRMSYGANRWPRQETLALLKIRSDMDTIFRDSTLKGPLWEDVSRKLAELGYHRSAKKCKEKFENVYKYHKRTKDGRTGKSEGKTYRFFDQLEAFESTHQSQPPPQQPPPPPSKPPQVTMATTTTTLPWSNPPNVTHATVPSTNHHNNVVNVTQITSDHTISPMPLSSSQPINPPPHHQHQHMVFSNNSLQNLTSHLFSSSTSSSTASDEELQQGSRKRKRRWKDFFERLTKDVIKKQEELLTKFLETIEKRESERIAREEAWRMQEKARINREHEILIQERTTAAAKDAAVISFLQKISGQQNSVQLLDISAPAPAPSPAPAPIPAPAPSLVLTSQPQPQPPPPAPSLVLTSQPQPQPPPPALAPVTVAQPRQPPPQSPSVQIPEKLDITKKENGQNNNAVGASPSRWPKVEVEALIRLRTNLDTKYQENGPKGPLWEEISAGMKRVGYNRNAKRCKEKWENINKYFKKVKESNKKRSEGSKTCPYFQQLDAIYKERGKNFNDNNNNNSVNHSVANPVSTMEPLMVRPEQQWPPQQGNLQQQQHMGVNNGRQIMDEDDEEEEDDEGDTEEEDEGGGGRFQVVASKPQASLGNGE